MYSKVTIITMRCDREDRLVYRAHLEADSNLLMNIYMIKEASNQYVDVFETNG